ncbi:MAG TPA: response regulator [Ktedonobacterales bacterium]|nr:response regulator [Ktedonobacterales bacterium]
MYPAPHTRRFAYPEPAAPEPPPPGAQPPSVVIIDDSRTVRAVAEACLSRCGYAVTGFAGGIEALAAFTRQQVAVPDLVLLDIGMPQMHGYEVAQILRSRPEFAHTTIVMLTGHDGVLDRLRSRMVGASAFITKPFKTEYLVRTVRGFLEPIAH